MHALLVLAVQRRRLGARRPLPDRPVGTPTVEVRHVLNKHATQMPLVQDQQVIQTFGSDRSHPSLRDGVGLGRSELIRGCRQADPYLLKLFAGVVPSQMKPAAVTSVTVVV